MRAAEAAAGVGEWELMQRAGAGAAQWVWRVAAGRAVTVLCGPGNNGGDGYVIAEWLRARGIDVLVVAPQEPGTDTARLARQSYAGEVWTERRNRHAPVLVDALFGYGLTRRLAGEFAALLEEASASHGYRIAIDVPSGVACDTGEVLGALPDYQLTLALGAWKRAHWLMPAAARMGALRLVPIGLELSDVCECLSARPSLAAPAADAHKYRRGLLGIVAGAMPGASLLAAAAAMRAGAGYVKLAAETPPPQAPAELVVEARSALLADPRTAAVLAGPGLGRDVGARAIMAAVLEARRPAVLDADALHLLDPDMIEGVDVTTLCLTPHEGELAALARSFGVTAQGKFARAQALHDATGLTVLAKGPDTLLVGSGGRVRYFPRGSSWLSVAGSGDVLAGAIAARLAAHGDPFRAAEEGVWLHHEAARIAGPALTAGELACAIRPALAQLL